MSTHRVYAWFEKEVLSWRIVSSVVRGLVLQLSALFVFNLILTFSPVTPVSWFTNNVGIFLTPGSWFYDLVVIGCFSGIALLQTKGFQMMTWIPENKLAALKQLAHPPTLVSLLAHVGAGGLVMRCFLGLQGGLYNSLTVPCKEGLASASCLNEGHVFLVLSGCYLGVCLWIDFHFRNGNVIEFPLLLLESGNAQLLRSLSPLLKTSFFQVVSDLKWFYLAYLVSGYRIENFLARLFGISVLGQISQRSWSSTFSLHVWILLTCVALLTLISFSVRIMKRVITINFTKTVSFPDEDSLVEAMSKSRDLIGFHACLDFAKMAASEKDRRAEFFVISQPGGHPHNWNLLSGRCLQMIDDFLKKLNESSQALRASHQVSAAKHQEVDAPKPKVLPGRPVESHSGVQDIPRVPVLLSGVQKQTTLISKVLGALADRLQRNPLLTSSPDAPLRTVFSESQPIIWTVEGLSHLITASVDEDRFGVVQKDLPLVLTALINLHQTVDRLKGLASSSGRKNRCESRDQQLKYELRAAVKAAIYRIVLKFGPHINSVPVPPDCSKRIQNFLNFMEG